VINFLLGTILGAPLILIVAFVVLEGGALLTEKCKGLIEVKSGGKSE